MSAQRFELTTRESLAHLHEQAIGRLCIIEHTFPLAIPISYSMIADESGVVVRTSPDTMLGRYEGPGSLEVDSIDLDTGVAWSVIARGTIRRVIGSHVLPDPEPLMTEGRTQWITLKISAISGRRFEVRASADGFSVDWQLASV